MRAEKSSSAGRMTQPAGPMASASMPFLLRDGLAPAHEFDVRRADVGDDADVAARAIAASGAISPGWFIPISSTAISSAAARPQKGPRHADVVVEIAFGFQHAESLRQHGGGEILGARLAVAAGDGDDLQRAAMRGKRARSAGKPRACQSTSINAKSARQPAGDSRAPTIAPAAPRAASSGDESVAVELVAAQRQEQFAGRKPRESVPMTRHCRAGSPWRKRAARVIGDGLKR